MLVLSREAGQSFAIGKDIVIEVVEIDRGKVKLSIKAPPKIGVWRTELIKKDQSLLNKSGGSKSSIKTNSK